MGNVTRVDFANKEIRKFKEEPTISRESVNEAIDILKNFIQEDYKAKIEATSGAQQVLLHEIESADEQFLREHAEEILMNLKDIRNARREAKECEKVKKHIVDKLNKVKIDNLYQALVASPKQEGSSEKYFNNKVKRTKTEQEYLEAALLKNMLASKLEEEDVHYDRES